MGEHSEEDEIRRVCIRMYDAMIGRDEKALRDVLDEDFVLVHMTGMLQSKEAFIGAVMDGTLRYYSAAHEEMPVEVRADTAVLTGRSRVTAAVFGGGRNVWRLELKCTLRRRGDAWKITGSRAGTY